MAYELLFEPVAIGPVTAPNRFYAVPHATGHGHMRPNGSIALREMKAEGGWGVVAMQMTEIGPDTDFANHPMDRLWGDEDLPAHARLVERIKAHGALCAIELAHGGMRSRNLTSGLPVIGPSHLPVIRPEMPLQARAMDKRDIAAFRQAHRRAAETARKAGYDIIYVYAAHDLSILSHFLSRRTNFRNDEYGGSLENRVRLLREVIEDTLDAAAGQCAVAVRFSVEEPGADLPLTHDGEGREVIEMLAELPDLWDINISGYSADSATSRFSGEAHQVEFMSFVKGVTTKPVVGVGRFTSPDKMVSLVRSGVMDLIGAARPSIADPFLPNKIKEGRIEDIRECIGCNICISSDSYGIPLRCTQNPTIAEEWRRGWHPEQVPATKREKSILIVGAGPAGLECALTLARAGHQVTIAETAEQPGGRVTAETALHGLSAWRGVRDYRVHQLRRMASVEFYLASEMTAETINEFGADHVVIATGAHWRRDGVGSSRFHPLPIPGCVTPADIMAGTQIGGPVLIYDDDNFYMGGVLALHLRAQGHEAHLITPLPEISAWTVHTLEQPRIVRKLTAEAVSWDVNLTLDTVENGAARFVCSYTGEAKKEVPFRSFVMVGARLPDTALYDSLSDTNNVTQIGDCLVPGTIHAAVFSGHNAARMINGDERAGAGFRREEAKLMTADD